MHFEPPLIKARLLKRYKRFLADVVLDNGEELTVHCPNTGSMKNCIVENSTCYLSDSNNPKRKYRYTWELATTPDGNLARINSATANALVAEAIEGGVIAELSGYPSLQREQKYGQEGSRIDLLLLSEAQRCYVEVKSVTLAVDDRQGLFPDAVSSRASKHLRELMAMRRQGYRAVLFYCVQHTGIDRVSPADEIDPEYGRLLRDAVSAGVEVLAYRADISPESIQLQCSLPVVLELNT
ncbi:DNA/RNA nuclease SfsA [Teredinibacter haidensis]|uniref:DNA/RNA nuclease SfsA n=1 Tax=Teredinibacter haidensis TaxID=2731755 RepID=UPI0009491A3D|nr:DNA/RNA nuclease SfsA [Teredinibacter haidensis]